MSHDYLNGTEYTVLQPENMYHFNSDSELLGRFARIRHKDSVLDIGCGTGVVLLYASCRKPKKMTGIDLFAEVISAAMANLERNGVQAELHTGRVQDFKDEQFDVILSNPPYFQTESDHLKNEDLYLRAARHEEYLSMEELFQSVRRLMKDNGRFYLVHRPDRINDLFATMHENDMHCTEMMVVYQSEGKNAKSILMEIRRGRKGNMKIDPPAYLDDRSTFPSLEE